VAWKIVVVPVVACIALAACQPLALSVAGAGVSAAIGHGLNGVRQRTFTANLPEVRKASVRALDNMGITLESHATIDAGIVLYARTGERSVEIELVPISARATRVRVAARDDGFFYDAATANEIVAQTEKILEAPGVTKFTTKARRVSTY
jgi:hypothetical protein